MKLKPFPPNTAWLNTDKPITLEELKGHVVLLDFWTYCCINCIHVLPELAWLEEKYKDEPVVVIGVHSAKFENEKDIGNIKHAIARYEINHPVLVDNSHRLWTVYGISAWPSFLLVGADGEIIGKAAGEGVRDALDSGIRKALKEGKDRGILVSQKVSIIPDKRDSAFLSYPGKLDIDRKRNHLFVSDSNNNRVLQIGLISKTKGEILEVIGGKNKGFKDGSYSEARFFRPQGIAFHKDYLFVCDTENHAIRRIDLDNWFITTIAGNGRQAEWGAKGGKGTDVSLNSPWDAVVQGRHLYIAMAGSHQIWRLDIDSHYCEVFAGSGRENIVDGPARAAQLAQPSGIAVGEGELIFADSEVSALRSVRIDNGYIGTYIGEGLFVFGLRDGDFDNALLQHPLGVHYNAGIVYIADTYNHAIRRADLKNRSLTTLLSRREESACDLDREVCKTLALNEPNDVIFHDNALYIADTNNHLLRVFDLDSKTLENLEIQ
ncbi:MAG: redoxin domain-containing protein [Clostridia bacterium]|nr:redoxin domain-containing protein [Clostridia bacterium]